MIGRRRVRVTVAALIKGEQCLPDGVELVRCYCDVKEGWWALLDHYSFDELSEGDVIPIWEPPTTPVVNDTITIKFTNTAWTLPPAPATDFLVEDWELKDVIPKPPKKKKWREFL